MHCGSEWISLVVAEAHDVGRSDAAPSLSLLIGLAVAVDEGVRVLPRLVLALVRSCDLDQGIAPLRAT